MDERNTIIVEVKSCSSPFYWYADKIGWRFKVFQDVYNDRYVLSQDNYDKTKGGHLDQLIRLEDCEICENETEPKFYFKQELTAPIFPEDRIDWTHENGCLKMFFTIIIVLFFIFWVIIFKTKYI